MTGILYRATSAMSPIGPFETYRLHRVMSEYVGKAKDTSRACSHFDPKWTAISPNVFAVTTVLSNV
jgi:hypothetical protein